MIKGTCYSIRGSRTERPRWVVLQGPPMGLPYGVYLEHPLCSYCNVVLLYYIRYYIHYLTPTF